MILGLCSTSLLSQRGFRAYNEKIPDTDISFRMVPIKGGSFNMGSTYSDANSAEDERPIHRVDLDPFWMADHETTWNLYQLFIRTAKDSLNNTLIKYDADIIALDSILQDSISGFDMDKGTDDYPVVNVSQFAASIFCEWLTTVTGHFYRLPTEAEWEYACRAGSERDYHFGRDDSLDDYAWFDHNSGDTYHPVKRKKANKWRLYDMHGNVAEWTLDQYLEFGYDRHENLNPYVSPKIEKPSVIRGGSWMDKASQLRCSARLSSSNDWTKINPEHAQNTLWFIDAPFLGFRVVRPYLVPTPMDQEKYWIHLKLIDNR